jgi:hypothetical protein
MQQLRERQNRTGDEDIPRPMAMDIT